MDHPFILDFCQHLTFYVVFTITFSTFWAKPTFFNYCLILIVLCISDSNVGDPALLLLLLFQNRTLISKQEPVLVVRSSQGHFLLFVYVSWLNKCNKWSFLTRFVFNFDILSDFASNILPEGLLFRPEGLLSNLE